MALDLAINASFKIDGKIYKADMSLPTSAPSATAPFVFLVTRAEEATPEKTTTLLTVAVGAASEVYVAVSPPTDLITAAVGDVVQTLDVKVSEGTYDAATKTFKTT